MTRVVERAVFLAVGAAAGHFLGDVWLSVVMAAGLSIVIDYTYLRRRQP